MLRPIYVFSIIVDFIEASSYI